MIINKNLISFNLILIYYREFLKYGTNTCQSTVVDNFSVLYDEAAENRKNSIKRENRPPSKVWK